VAETVLNQQGSSLDSSTDTQHQNSHFKKIVGVTLCLTMISLTIYVLNFQHQNFNILFKSTDLALTASGHATINYRTYVTRYKDTKIELDETTHKLQEVNRQLDQVSDELTMTKGMLSQGREENIKLKQELHGLGNLPNKDSQASSQLSELKSQLRAFDVEFSNLEESQSLIVLIQNKIKMVKNRMRYLKREAILAKVAAQKEKDRLAVFNGNTGFVLRNGHAQNPNGTNKSFAIDVKIVQ
jgi:predicted nuclease with TOPRIM domain